MSHLFAIQYRHDCKMNQPVFVEQQANFFLNNKTSLFYSEKGIVIEQLTEMVLDWPQSIAILRNNTAKLNAYINIPQLSYFKNRLVLSNDPLHFVLGLQFKIMGQDYKPT